MASRHLRRLRGDAIDIPAVLSTASEESSEGEAEGNSSSKKKAFNPYECLAALEAEDGEPDSDIERSNQNGAQEKTSAHQELLKPNPLNDDNPTQDASISATKKKKKNRKKKNKKKGKDTEKCEMDDIDKLVQELNLQTVGKSSDVLSAPGPSAPDEPSKKPHILGCKSGSLRADEELYRIFGAQVVASEEAQMRKEKNQRFGGRNTKGFRGLKKKSKNCWLVDVQEHWPPRDGGLAMEYEGLKDGCHWFRYTHSPNYHEVQDLFEECQATGDPNTVAALMQKNPWHVDTLLAMHDLYRATGEHLYAEEMLNRCLFALESAWHPFFTPTLGTCRLDIKVPENKALFRALFRHMQYLSRRGCLATALECCKLLLSLDNGDPMGALCVIDYFAIRAGKFDFLQRLVDEVDNSSSLAVMPGITYSTALSKFKQSKELQSSTPSGTSSPPKSTGEASNGGGDSRENPDIETEAKEALIQAILLYPVVVVRLVGKLKETGVGIDSEFSSILSRPLFAKANDGKSASLCHLVNLFVERHHLLWKSPEVIHWLKKSCGVAAEALDNGGCVGGVTADDWGCVRAQAFPPTEVNEYRHLHLYDFSDDASQLPPEALQEAGGDMEGAFADMEERMAAALRNHGGQQGLMQLTQEDLENGNPLVLFLRSMLPWVQARNPDPPPPG